MTGLQVKANQKFNLFLYIFGLIAFIFLSQCKKESVPEAYKPTNSHDAYIHSLRMAGLAHTALGRDWILASEEALREPIDIETPYEEAFYVDQAAAFAAAYRFHVKRGQRTEVDVVFQGQRRCRLFMDLFRVQDSTTEEWKLVASANEKEKHLEFEPRRDAEYVVRLQPELLRGGRFNVIIRTVASLEFPVDGYDSQSIGSFFGAPRDGGRRKHHGVDIFAPRHTPVHAPSKAYVRHVGESDRGGRNIWLYDSKRLLHLYFAHLQTQDVIEGTYVQAWQKIGTIGNTGNARRTPPHLHFGIYAQGEGPIDPYNYIHKINSVPEDIRADLEMLGRWVRSKDQKISLKASSVSGSQRLTQLDRYSAMKVLAAASNMYRVHLPDGISGYVLAQGVELAGEILESKQANQTHAVMDSPMEHAVIKEQLGVGEEFSILGQFEEFWMVRTHRGTVGWLSVTAAESAPSSNR
jgi:hypothetical protein